MKQKLGKDNEILNNQQVAKIESVVPTSSTTNTRLSTLTRDVLLTLFSICVGIGLFFISKPILIKVFAEELGFDQMVNLKYTVETRLAKNGFSQIVLIDKNGKVTFITDEKYPHASPQTDDTYIAYMAQPQSTWQIYLYNIKTKKTIQLTQFGNNVNPQISNGKIVWEGFIDNKWQVFSFDGTRTLQVTKGGESKQDTDIENDLIVYSEVDNNGWKIKTYDLKTKKETQLNDRYPGGNPKLVDNLIIWESFDGFTTYEYSINTKNITKKASSDRSKLANSTDSDSLPQESETVLAKSPEENENNEETNSESEIHITKETKNVAGAKNTLDTQIDLVDIVDTDSTKVDGTDATLTQQDILEELNIDAEEIEESTQSTTSKKEGLTITNSLKEE